MIHVHKDRADAQSLVDVENDFVGEKKKERTCLENLLKTMSQTRQLFSPSQHTPKVRKRIKRLDQKVCFTRKARGGSNQGALFARPCPPPVIWVLLRA